jgi:hypothetical protein
MLCLRLPRPRGRLIYVRAECQISRPASMRRARPIQVVSQHKIDIGVTQWNADCRLVDFIQFVLQSFSFRRRQLCLKCVFNYSEPPTKLAQTFLDKPCLQSWRKAKNWNRALLKATAIRRCKGDQRDLAPLPVRECAPPSSEVWYSIA